MTYVIVLATALAVGCVWWLWHNADIDGQSDDWDEADD